MKMTWYAVIATANTLDACLESLSSSGISSGEKKAVTAMRRKIKDFKEYAENVMKMSSEKRKI